MQHAYSSPYNNIGQEYIGDVPHNAGPGSPIISSSTTSSNPMSTAASCPLLLAGHGSHQEYVYCEFQQKPAESAYGEQDFARSPGGNEKSSGNYHNSLRSNEQYAENLGALFENEDINYRFLNGYPELTPVTNVNAPPPEPDLDDTDKSRSKSGSDTTDKLHRPRYSMAYHNGANTVKAGVHRATKDDLRPPGTYCSLPGYMKQKNSHSLFSCYPDCKGERYGPDGFDRWWNLKVHLENCHGQNIPKKWAS